MPAPVNTPNYKAILKIERRVAMRTIAALARRLTPIQVASVIEELECPPPPRRRLLSAASALPALDPGEAEEQRLQA